MNSTIGVLTLCCCSPVSPNSAACQAWRSYLPRFWTTNGRTFGNAEQALAGGVDGEAAQVAGDPAAAELLGDGRVVPLPTEAIEDQVAFVGGGFDDAFEQGFGLLSRVVDASLRLAN